MMSCRFSRLLFLVTPKFIPKIHTRRLTLHEYQCQQILKDHGIPIPRAYTVQTPDEARTAARNLGSPCIIKAQILDSGRGAGSFENGLNGAVQIVSSPSQAGEIAAKMLGQRFRIASSNVDRHFAEKLYVCEMTCRDSERYLAMTIDREKNQLAIILSKTVGGGGGGVDAEALSREQRDDLSMFNFGLDQGITQDLMGNIEMSLGTSGRETENLRLVLASLHRIFVRYEATSLEINSLVRLADGSFKCLDPAFQFDDAAQGRQQQLFALRDKRQEVQDEVEAEQHGLVYVRMDGNVGTVVNGAGLAMATNDAIGFHGGASANFLDAGGKATRDTMIQAFRIITRDDRVKAILVNIYGGLTRCDMIAESIVGAVSELDIKVPMVVRLQGTNSDKGLRMLEEANLGLDVQSGFSDAARRAVELAKSS